MRGPSGNAIAAPVLYGAVRPKIVMRGQKKQPRGSGPKSQKGDKSQAKPNKHLAGQIRKILGKHYASKYRVQSRQGG